MTDQELTLKDYVERRIDRLAADIDQKMKAQHHDILTLVDSNDLRYQQRFEAQGKELDKAFSAAKGAVDAALAAADKAAVKAEISADKRFEDLGGLIREQFKSVLEKIDAISARTSLLEVARSDSSGVGKGLSMAWVIGLGALGGTGVLISIILGLIAMFKP